MCFIVWRTSIRAIGVEKGSFRAGQNFAVKMIVVEMLKWVSLVI